MQFMETSVQIITPDQGGLNQFRVTGDEIQLIQKAIHDEFLQPPKKLLDKFNKDTEAYNKKYPEKSIDNPDPPEMPVASGIPGDFVLIIASVRAKTGRATTVQAAQETTVYNLYGSASVRKFLIDKCGIQI